MSFTAPQTAEEFEQQLEKVLAGLKGQHMTHSELSKFLVKADCGGDKAGDSEPASSDATATFFVDPADHAAKVKVEYKGSVQPVFSGSATIRVDPFVSVGTLSVGGDPGEYKFFASNKNRENRLIIRFTSVDTESADTAFFVGAPPPFRDSGYGTLVARK